MPKLRRGNENRLAQSLLNRWRSRPVVHRYDLGDCVARLSAPKAHALERRPHFFQNLRFKLIVRPRLVRVLLLLIASAPALLLAEAPLAVDLFTTENLLGPELIVRPATNAKILGGVSASHGSWLGMIEFEKRARFAATAVGRDIGAAHAVALEDLSPCRSRNSSRCRRPSVAPTPRSFHLAEALSLELGEQQIDGTLDHRAEVAARVGVTHEIAAELEFFAKAGTRRELDAEASF
jgi:hypothetical protein